MEKAGANQPIVRGLVLNVMRYSEEHRELIVRVAGYSDYFCDLTRALQEEIIDRTEQKGS